MWDYGSTCKNAQHDFYVFKPNILEVIDIPSFKWLDLGQSVKHLWPNGAQNSVWENKVELAERKHTCSGILKVEVFLHPYGGLQFSMKWNG